MVVVIINGYPQSGKDTFVELCDKYCDVDNVLTSTPAKNALTLLGWDGEKTPEIRDLLSDLMYASYEYFDGPIKYVLEKIHDSKADIVFIHCREPHNIIKLKQNIPMRALTLFINRSEARNVLYTNDSDRGVEDYDYDMYISNNQTLEELEEKAGAFVSIVLKGAY